MNIYSSLYYNLCHVKSKDITEHISGSNIHRHHILPKHSGGLDEESNYAYLTIREHKLAHFLLWKIHKNPNDLRAYHMLGGNLTSYRRKVIGKFCAKNKLGFHNPKWDNKRKAWCEKGLETQKQSGSKKTFYYWSTEEGRKERASLGGKASIVSGNNHKFIEQIGSFKDKSHAKKCGAKSGKLPATNGTETKKFKTKELRETFISDNPNWRIGVHWSRSKVS